MNDDTGRQIAYCYLGRNGYDGRPNGLAGPSDQTGRPLTNAELSNIFLSEEARNWRDRDFPNLYAERDRLRSETANQKAHITIVEGQRDQAYTDKAAATAERDKALTENSQLKSANATLVAQNEALTKRVAELEAQGNVDVTINFNTIGLIFWSLIKTVGLKK